MTYMATPLHKNSCPGGHEIYSFGKHFLVHYYYILRFFHLYAGVKKNIFKEILHFLLYDLYGHASAQEPLFLGVMKFTILVDTS